MQIKYSQTVSFPANFNVLFYVGVSLDYHAQTRNVKLSRTHVGVGCDSCRVSTVLNIWL